MNEKLQDIIEHMDNQQAQIDKLFDMILELQIDINNLKNDALWKK